MKGHLGGHRASGHHHGLLVRTSRSGLVLGLRHQGAGGAEVENHRVCQSRRYLSLQFGHPGRQLEVELDGMGVGDRPLLGLPARRAPPARQWPALPLAAGELGGRLGRFDETCALLRSVWWKAVGARHRLEARPTVPKVRRTPPYCYHHRLNKDSSGHRQGCLAGLGRVRPPGVRSRLPRSVTRGWSSESSWPWPSPPEQVADPYAPTIGQGAQSLHLPRVKSGNSTGALPLATLISDSPHTALSAAAS